MAKKFKLTFQPEPQPEKPADQSFRPKPGKTGAFQLRLFKQSAPQNPTAAPTTLSTQSDKFDPWDPQVRASRQSLDRARQAVADIWENRALSVDQLNAMPPPPGIDDESWQLALSSMEGPLSQFGAVRRQNLNTFQKMPGATRSPQGEYQTDMDLVEYEDVTHFLHPGSPTRYNSGSYSGAGRVNPGDLARYQPEYSNEPLETDDPNTLINKRLLTTRKGNALGRSPYPIRKDESREDYYKRIRREAAEAQASDFRTTKEMGYALEPNSSNKDFYPISGVNSQKELQNLLGGEAEPLMSAVLSGQYSGPRYVELDSKDFNSEIPNKPGSHYITPILDTKTGRLIQGVPTPEISKDSIRMSEVYSAQKMGPKYYRR